MARRSFSLLFALLLVLAATAAAVAVEGDAEAELVEVEETSDEGMPPFLGEDFEGDLPGGIAAKWGGDPAEVDDLPYGLAKKLQPCLLPPGQAKKAETDPCDEEAELVETAEEESDEGMPPFLVDGYEGELPPGIGAKWDGDRENVDGLPYGLAKKVNPGAATHPGKGKKADR